MNTLTIAQKVMLLGDYFATLDLSEKLAEEVIQDYEKETTSYVFEDNSMLIFESDMDIIVTTKEEVEEDE